MTKKAILIRELEQRDIPRLCSLYDELLEIKHDATIMKQNFEKIKEDPNNHILVACDDDYVVGTLQYTLCPALAFDSSPFEVLEYLIIDSNYRRQGIARRLFEVAMDFAKAHNADSVFFVSSGNRTEAHIMYKNLGYNDDVVGFRKTIKTSDEYNR